jgi:mannose/fructose/N-acetylgalactosamine-specific phosphotransferase system component IID
VVKGLGSVGWRSFFAQAAKNYRSMLGMGYAFSELPLHKRQPIEQRKPELAQSAEFFNTMPYFIPLTIGMTVRARQNDAGDEAVRGLKKTVLGPFGALGDAFFWATLKPTAAVLGALFAFMVNPMVGILVLIFTFNIFHIPLRFCGAYLGYNLLTNVPSMLERLKPYRIIAGLQILLGIAIGLKVVGLTGNFGSAGAEIRLSGCIISGMLVGIGGSLLRLPLQLLWMVAAGLAICVTLL